MSATKSVSQTIHTGGDPRHFAEFGALRDEMAKLIHPARPDVNWQRVEQLCLALFRQNGVELQSAVDFTVARVHQAGLAGLSEGLELLNSLISQQWSVLWPPQVHAKVELLSWLSDRLQQVWRTMTLCYGDLAQIYRAERSLEQLCTQLQMLELKHVSKLDGVHQLLRNAAVRLESTEAPVEEASEPAVSDAPQSPLLGEPVTNTLNSPLVYVMQEKVHVTHLPQAVVESRWTAQRAFWAGIALSALLISGGFWTWKQVSHAPLRDALAATVRPLPVQLALSERENLKRTLSNSEWSELADPILQASTLQLEQLGTLPPLWALQQGDALVLQAQYWWPNHQEVTQLSTQWKQQRHAAAVPVIELESYAQTQEQLRALAERLSQLDEKKGSYITGSALKTTVFAIQQSLNRTTPLEELLRQYQAQIQAGGIPSLALRQQIDSRFNQLLNRYALLAEEVESK